MKKIIFLCTGNSCRSQMAEGFAKYMLLGKRNYINSAGVEAHGLNPFAVQVMKEVGIDIGGQKSKELKSLDLSQFELVVTVCDSAKKKCPIILNTTTIHQTIIDPALSLGTVEEQIKVYRQVRDQISVIVKKILMNYEKICQELN